MTYETVVFDLDGTLLNTLDDMVSSTNYALRAMDWPERSREEVRSFVGNGIKALIDRAAPEEATPRDRAACLAIFKDYYAAHMADETAPYPGICDVLSRLRDKGMKLGVVSNKPAPAVAELCRQYFPGLLHATAGESSAAPKKPDPAMVHQLLRELGSEAATAVYVGDSDVDIATAKNAGLPCISVTWGFRDRTFLLRHGGEKLVCQPEELLEVL